MPCIFWAWIFLLLYVNHILNPQKCGKLFCAITRLVVFVHDVCSFVFSTWIHLCRSFTQMPCGMLVVFLFVELQLVGVVIRGVSWFVFWLKKDTQRFNDFVFVFGLKLPKELNLSEALDLGICCVKEMRKRKRGIKEKALAFVTRAPSLFLPFIFTFFS